MVALREKGAVNGRGRVRLASDLLENIVTDDL